MKYRLFLLFIGIVLSDTVSSQPLYFPPVSSDDQWEKVSPTALGWCQAEIQPLFDMLEKENTKAFLVLKNGKIAIEKYFGTFTKDSLWYWASAGKTITSFLIGQAQKDGSLNINDLSSKYLGNVWTSCTAEQENKIKILHQLTMTTGLNDGVPDNHCTLKPCLQCLADPGTRWAYHNAPYTLLEKVIVNATGLPINTYTQQKLKTPTGMTGLWLTVDYNNVYFSSAKSMARFGLLVQNRGIWGKDTLLKDMDYITKMTSTSQNLNKSYGYLWWLNGKANFMLPGLQFAFQGSWASDAPSDMFAALGKNGQILSISPSKGLVIVRMGNPSDSPLTEIGVVLCNNIWQKLNAILCGTASVPVGSKTNLLIFPNPASDSFQINGGEGPSEIFNSCGEKVWEETIQQGEKIDVSRLKNGLYLFKNKQSITKFLIAR